jgi:succinate dehydrogenase hydrophobic anchor subunit
MMQPADAPGAPVTWRLIRVTALFLAVLLPVHLVVVVVGGDIGRATFVTVTDRLAGRWWPGLEWATLVLALTHGFLVIRDRVIRSRAPARVRDGVVVAAGVSAVLLAVGVTWAMLRFS